MIRHGLFDAQKKSAINIENTSASPLSPGNDDQKMQLPSFAQNFTNGHLVISGSSITSNPSSILTAQSLFKNSLDKAKEKVKAGEKVLAFWGYVTSLLSSARQ
ncbi:uncharacterized protein NEPG_02236 [Nematocida parisii ERTm1]|uniref:Uncharacterized protein n=1 Tax=Nematocida parisii (strain ERTm3) TaxID=935791 RepID=I3EEG2_NEMP3|nr:uncharacterized protein NEPG_02236 [Nematocida parisii ERTm1]EIJ87609.1 hypothetical protein NEQG_02156 [Nematocida parisii ERTm3]EIJ92837.1 hypothetical protein NEPG_02236 [Nematocida parisii ERTm1]|eukprot:XP_013060063.1 hypothetical protein NEPG_02236 [Nematocida parisii ERTm1]